MGRINKFGKRKFYGNRFTKKTCQNSEDITMKTTVTPSTEKHSSPSSSGKKLSHLAEENDEFFVNSAQSGSIIVNISLLSKLLKSFVKCKFCDSDNCIEVLEEANARRGLASKISLKCCNCENKASTMLSEKLNKGYDVNIRLSYAMRCIGKSRSAAHTFCAIMDLPPPPTKFLHYSGIVLDALKKVAEESMQNAAKEAVAVSDTNSDIAAAFDGSWQKRGHTSLNGVVTATILDTGKVIDVECLSKYCHKCAVNKNTVHDCSKNYEGYSGGMECVGVKKIFDRSEESRGVRYTKYLGDGDSKGFLKVREANVYGNLEVEKLECCGHVQKRMGARLRRLVNEMKGKKLEDGKQLSGKGRLTETQIGLLQNYYKMAIMRNVRGDVKVMKKDIWATFFHKLSTAENPIHGLCPKGENSWCRYQKAISTGRHYEHKNSLPEAVMNAIKPIYRDLSNVELLKKCLHGKTQNPNESFHHCIWERVPKTTFVSLNTLKIGVYDAVICFNDGCSGRIKVLKELGIEPGSNMTDALYSIDVLRLKKAEKDVKEMSREARLKKKAVRRKLIDEEKANQDDYVPGMC